MGLRVLKMSSCHLFPPSIPTFCIALQQRIFFAVFEIHPLESFLFLLVAILLRSCVAELCNIC